MPAPPAPINSDWIVLPDEPLQPTLRCWWTRPAVAAPRGAVLVLPEVFGLNSWVRSLADRLALAGYAALALPIFARSAPGLELGYDEAGLVEGRKHRDLVSADACLADASRAIAWLQQQPGLEGRGVGCVGFCFGGHLAMLVATLPQVAICLDFYGARVSSIRPGGGAPTLEVVPQIPGELICLVGDQDPLMPAAEIEAIATALAASGSTHRRDLVVLPGAGHGFMCEQRSDYDASAAQQGWSLMLDALQRSL
jgi:carboxymethylenebutenolidase